MAGVHLFKPSLQLQEKRQSFKSPGILHREDGAEIIMNDWVVHQYASLSDAIKAMTDGQNVFAIDLNNFEEILEIEYHTYNDLLSLSLGHTLVFIGLERKDF